MSLESDDDRHSLWSATVGDMAGFFADPRFKEMSSDPVRHKEEMFALVREYQSQMEQVLSIRIEEARYLHDCTIWLRFLDGESGPVDFAGSGGVPIEPALFREFAIDYEEGSSLHWPNGMGFIAGKLHYVMRMQRQQKPPPSEAT